MADDRLTSLREELSALDAQLLDLVARRTALSLEIGREKRRMGRGTRDFRREKVVLRRARTQAEALGLPPVLAERLTLHLIEASLSAQEQDRVSQAGGGEGQDALVIGGAGKMGRWFTGFLAAQGFEVEVADPAGPVDDLPHRPAWSEGRLDHDLVVVATPLHLTGEVLTKLAAHRPSGVVFDIGSLKSPVAEGLRAAREAGVRITSLHPMFGPDTSLLSGRHVLFCDVGCAEATEVARGLFAATMAAQSDMDLETHDRLIAFVLGLSHAVNLSFATALAASGEALPLLSEISSTTFDAQLAVSSAVSRENPQLYYEIQALNDHGRTSLDALADAVALLRDLVDRHDEHGFVEMMERGRDYLARRDVPHGSPAEPPAP